MNNNPLAVGDCYEQAYKWITSNFGDHLRLVHGLIKGQGPLEGKIIDHAWCEDLNLKLVYDNTLPIPHRVMSMSKYYKISRLDEKSLLKYTTMEAIDLALDAHTYGPWDKDRFNFEIK